MISEDHGDPYMMSIAIVNHFLIGLLALRVSNPRYELDEAWVTTHITYKRSKLCIDIFLVFWLVNNEKQSMIQSNVRGDLSQCKPNE